MPEPCARQWAAWAVPAAPSPPVRSGGRSGAAAEQAQQADVIRSVRARVDSCAEHARPCHQVGARFRPGKQQRDGVGVERVVVSLVVGKLVVLGEHENPPRSRDALQVMNPAILVGKT